MNQAEISKASAKISFRWTIADPHPNSEWYLILLEYVTQTTKRVWCVSDVELKDMWYDVICQYYPRQYLISGLRSLSAPEDMYSWVRSTVGPQETGNRFCDFCGRLHRGQQLQSWALRLGFSLKPNRSSWLINNHQIVAGLHESPESFNILQPWPLRPAISCCRNAGWKS